MKVIKHEVHDTHFSVLIQDKKIKVWVDVSVENKDLDIDWNKYIFHLDNDEDVKVKQYQEDLDNCDTCFSLATSYLEEQNLIYQSNKGNWFLYPSKEEIETEMNLHNENEVGIDSQWSFEDAEYHLLLSDKYNY